MADAGVRRDVSGYDESVEEEIFRFLKAGYPARREDLLAPRWRWMFLASARRLGVEPMVWLSWNASAIVGHHGSIPVRLKVGDDEHATRWAVETMVLEAARGKGIGPILLEKSMKDEPFCLSLGQTPPMRAIQFELGWRQVASLGTYVYVLDAARLLSGKLGGPIPRMIAAAGLAAAQRARHLWGRARPSWRPTVSEVDRFDERHDRLWREVKSDYACAVVRDSSYLNWKYVEQPGQQFVRLEIRNAERLVAIAIVTIVEPAGEYRYRRAFLVDLVVPASDPAVVWTVLEEVRRLCAERDVDLLVLYLIHEKLVQLARSFGFLARSPERVLLLWTAGISDPVRRQVLDGRNWLVTMGDSDIDRP